MVAVKQLHEGELGATPKSMHWLHGLAIHSETASWHIWHAGGGEKAKGDFAREVSSVTPQDKPSEQVARTRSEVHGQRASRKEQSISWPALKEADLPPSASGCIIRPQAMSSSQLVCCIAANAWLSQLLAGAQGAQAVAYCACPDHQGSALHYSCISPDMLTNRTSSKCKSASWALLASPLSRQLCPQKKQRPCLSAQTDLGCHSYICSRMLGT